MNVRRKGKHLVLEMESQDEINKVGAVIGDLDIDEKIGFPLGICGKLRKETTGGALGCRDGTPGIRRYTNIMDDLLGRERTF